MGEMGLVEEEEAMKSPVMVVLMGVMETVQMEGMGQGRTFPLIHLNTSTSVMGKGGHNLHFLAVLILGEEF